MKKHLCGKIILLFCIVIAPFLIAYVGLAVYYRNAFEYGTWINSIYCTGKSIEEINAELSGKFTYDGITIYDREQNAYQISARDIDFQYDFREALQSYLEKQNSWLWVDSLRNTKQETIKPVIYYSENKLEACLDSMAFLQEGDHEDRRVEIIKTDHGYELINERQEVLDVGKAKQTIRAALLDTEPSVTLWEAGCYYDMGLSREMQEILHNWDLVKAFQDCHIVYQMGEELIPIDASVVCDWILLDEDGSFALNEAGELQLRENAIEEFVAGLAAEYDTVGGIRQFRTTARGVVTIEGGIYGNRIDQEAERSYLAEAFANGADEIHTPVYLQEAWKKGKEDIGDTYIEIDMGEQMMYYYLNGELQIETPVVTGNTARRMGTPAGVNYVYAKQTNRILRGEGYAAHVNFWMPVKGNIGIHDASWRSSYGGTIYQTNGSHGCINTPYEAMSRIYDMVEVGTPVVMFY